MIQLALSDYSYRSALRDLLVGNGSGRVICVEDPDVAKSGILVLDPEHLRRIPLPINHPERIVLIAGNRSEDLETAWQAGLQSVVLRDDPIHTTMLAVLSAGLCSPGGEYQNLGSKF